MLNGAAANGRQPLNRRNWTVRTRNDGSALLLFSHGEALRLDVECLECELTDLGTDDLGASDLAIAPEG